MNDRESKMITLRTDESGKPTVWCDPEIADLVDALNTDKLSTVASCSGHGHRPGRISLKDGRELLVMNSEQVATVERLFGTDINGASQESAPGQEAVAEIKLREGDLRYIHWNTYLQQLPEGTKLYLAPPTVQAAVAAFMQKAIEVCNELANSPENSSDYQDGAEWSGQRIRSLPGGAKALDEYVEEKCIDILRSVFHGLRVGQWSTVDDPRAIVQSVIRKE
jgi:hypothetical protein